MHHQWCHDLLAVQHFIDLAKALKIHFGILGFVDSVGGSDGGCKDIQPGAFDELNDCLGLASWVSSSETLTWSSTPLTVPNSPSTEYYQPCDSNRQLPWSGGYSPHKVAWKHRHDIGIPAIRALLAVINLGAMVQVWQIGMGADSARVR